ncbi:daunorubicin resistance protein DrrA family ABC transporter ATP-binding protein [Dictyobacter alpinus]|uniref:Daunorubicin resistance protein DrrA family ABC transporter ATP-binding protein n=1 Tax=Dictyobacter alpinus TaxID=2014873 RepID=A0A402BD27_9CHLR|nr:ABC transporter ATP-binding protein [Dictyobacter alpinus]GCE29301.1 daunorubicin resistance protein DrrA family ABC transporter ATP-binding protein [Dictyobacter alpinus]
MNITAKPASIELENLSKLYKGPQKTTITAVENLSLSIGGSQVFGILGANGAGKTTTIKMMCGLITPTSGTVRLNGHDVTRQRSQAARQIGAVLEGTRNIYWRLTAWDNLMYFGRLKGCTGKKLVERGERLLRELDLWERRDSQIRNFSRGMQQKVAVAVALIADPPIVLLDEPTLGLDIEAALTVKAWIARLAREEGKTIILTTHQLDLAQDLCEHVTIMRKGQILANKPLSELLYLFEKDWYQVKVHGELSTTQQQQLPGWEASYQEGKTLLKGTVTNQEQLQQILALLCAWERPIHSVNQAEPNLEEVFVTIIAKDKENEQHVHDLAYHR